MKYSHSLELYKAGICNLENEKEFKRITKEFKALEKYFINKGADLEEIRKNILISFKFCKKLKIKERINHIIGIIYARHYFNEEDLYGFLDSLEQYNNSKYCNQTLFSKLKYKEMTDVYDKEGKNIDSYDKIIDDFSEYINNDSDICILPEEDLDSKVEEIKTSEIVELDPEEKLEYVEEKYNTYKMHLLDSKNYSKNDKFKISRAMDDWFKYMMQNLKDLYKIDCDIHKLNDKSLIKNDWL